MDSHWGAVTQLLDVASAWGLGLLHLLLRLLPFALVVLILEQSCRLVGQSNQSSIVGANDLFESFIG
jgi:hypothetical protein